VALGLQKPVRQLDKKSCPEKERGKDRALGNDGQVLGDNAGNENKPMAGEKWKFKT